MKKRIVCYGDSNTWGYNAATRGRFADDERWTGVLQSELGDGYTVIEEGLCARTTVWDDPVEQYSNGQGKNGYTYLLPMIDSHKPFDLIIIMLGSNDLKRRFSVSARDIAESAAMLAKTVMRSDCGRNANPPKVLLVAPIHVGNDVLKTWFGEIFEQDCIIRSRHFNHWFSEFAHELGTPYLNAAEFAQPDPVDSLHIPVEGHKSLGVAMAKKVKSIIG